MNARALEGLISQILRLSRRMRRESGRGPSAAELAGYLHLPLAEVRAALARAKALAAEARGGTGAAGMEVPGGLNEALTAEEERALEAVIRTDPDETKAKVVAGLSPREQEALRKRFGLGETADATLEEVGRQFSVTRARLSEIGAKARRRPARKTPGDP